MQNITGLVPRLVSVNMAANYLSISRAYVYVLVNKGELKPVRIGKRILFTREELDQFIDKLKGIQRLRAG